MRGQRVDARIAHLFLSLAERMSRKTGATIEISLQLTRQEIADLVGTTVESAIRVMSRAGAAKGWSSPASRASAFRRSSVSEA